MVFQMMLSKKIELEGYLLLISKIEIVSQWLDLWLMNRSYKIWIKWSSTNWDLSSCSKLLISERESSTLSKEKPFKIKNLAEICIAQWWIPMSMLSMKVQFPILKTPGTTCVSNNAEKLLTIAMNFLLNKLKITSNNSLNQKKISKK